MKRIYILLICPLLAVACLAAKPALRFGKDGKFKIVQFTDIHWQPANAASEAARQCMEAVLDAEHPDLVVYTGDLAWAAPADEAVRRAVQPCIDRKIPFAVTWGNHDAEFDRTRRQLTDMVMQLPGCLVDTVPGLSGMTNYVLEIQPADGSRQPSALLYVLDSHAACKLPAAKGYDGIQADQVEWYRQRSLAYTAANGGEPLPALAFFHVPLNEVNTAAQREGAPLVGTRREAACSPSLNSGMFSAIVRAGDVMGCFFGHDHINDYAVAMNGVLMAYGRYTGGPTVYCDIAGGNGARVIELTQGERGLRSYIRLADGTLLNYINFPHDFNRWKASNNE